MGRVRFRGRPDWAVLAVGLPMVVVLLFLSACGGRPGPTPAPSLTPTSTLSVVNMTDSTIEVRVEDAKSPPPFDLTQPWWGPVLWEWRLGPRADKARTVAIGDKYWVVIAREPWERDLRVAVIISQPGPYVVNYDGGSAPLTAPGAPAPQVAPPPPTVPPIDFDVPTELVAYLGEPYFYCFCSPLDMASEGLCGGLSPMSLPTNPTGGSGPPYTFQRATLSEFLPLGLTLHLGGILDGTVDPKARVGPYNLEICAIDSSRSFVCKKVKLRVEGVRVQQWELIFQFPGPANYVHNLQVYPDGAFTGTRQNPQELPYCKVGQYMLAGNFSGDQVSFSGAVKQTCLVSGVERELYMVDSANGQANAPFPNATTASGTGTAETWALSTETQSGWGSADPITLSFSWTARRIDTPTSTPPPSSVSTAGWLVYTSPYHGYSVMRPPDWTVSGGTDPETAVFLILPDPRFENAILAEVAIYAGVVSPTTTPDALADAYLLNQPDARVVSRRSVTLSGLPAVELVVDLGGQRFRWVFTTAGTQYFVLQALTVPELWDTYSSIFDKIFDNFSITR